VLPVTHYVRSLDCAHKLRLRLLLHKDLTEADLEVLAAALESELEESVTMTVQRFSEMARGAHDLAELRTPALFASGALSGRELQITFGKLGTASDPEALPGFLAAADRSPLGPLEPLAAPDRNSVRP
jgi:hypothetical protein